MRLLERRPDATAHVHESRFSPRRSPTGRVVVGSYYEFATSAQAHHVRRQAATIAASCLACHGLASSHTVENLRLDEDINRRIPAIATAATDATHVHIPLTQHDLQIIDVIFRSPIMSGGVDTNRKPIGLSTGLAAH